MCWGRSYIHPRRASFPFRIIVTQTDIEVLTLELKSDSTNSLHTNSLRHPVFRIQHPRRRSNDLQRTQDRSPSINRFTPRVAIMSDRNDQRRRTRRFGPLFSLRLRCAVDLLRSLLASRGQNNRLYGHDGLLLGFFLQRPLLRLLLRLVLLLIGSSKGADSS